MFFLYFGKKAPVRRTGAFRHKKALLKSAYTVYDHFLDKKPLSHNKNSFTSHFVNTSYFPAHLIALLGGTDARAGLHFKCGGRPLSPPYVSTHGSNSLH